MINLIGVVADDTTGANDIGIMFRKNQYTTKVVTFEDDLKLNNDSDVVIVDTDSRLDPPSVSYNRVYKATKSLMDLNCSIYFNKTCSVFRGNIGEEFDAMLDALNEDFCVVILAFPKNGRKTVDGIHTVHDKLLEDSEFANDPVHPMTESNLVSILSKQTSRKVTSVELSVVRSGASFLKNKIAEVKKTGYNYCIVDAETQEDLSVIAEAVKEIKVLAGSSAIAEELPKFLDKELVENPIQTVEINDNQGVLVVSGSLTPQTRAQTAYLISNGVPSIIFDSRKVFDPEVREKEISLLAEEAKSILKQGKDVLVLADNDANTVKETKEIGSKQNIDPLVISKMVSAALAEITEQIVKDLDLKRLVVAGGDTSGTVSRKLGIKGNYVLEEIATGVPSGLALGRDMFIVLKSGSFGKEDFLYEAINHLKNLNAKENVN
ncbi:four-carbon acid sugar kinase family protein [Metabacillus endolithicus]|uniref:Four-carbon acid sugar kinase family protein n=1 Tax=Metabacillus endolithicus TaxID=1535204 RepID=A0ABW5BZB0_9BACI|nr:four-carbon acid sugar kinase family protein [Metabacillus endolithicus]UPG62514.1 four-carbon acid sugar kinase family protein [Metabacillus endolithicus]